MANNLVSLKKQAEFLDLKQQGERVIASPWMLVSYKTNQNKGLRCGWTIPKKYANAVTRNKLKRWCREFFRPKTAENFDVDINVVLRAKDKDFFKKLEHRNFEAKLAKAWKQLSANT